jgi:hypothetical protein
MQVTTVGVDLAKSIFQVHGTDALGRAVLMPRLRRGRGARIFCQSSAALDRARGLRWCARVGARSLAKLIAIRADTDDKRGPPLAREALSLLARFPIRLHRYRSRQRRSSWRIPAG